MQYKPYVSQNVGELLDQLGFMVLAAPKFRDKTGYFPQQNIDTVFSALNEGLRTVRNTLGEVRYTALRSMSDKMRTLFESDPDDKTGDAQAGRMLIYEMEDILTDIAKQEASP